MLNTSKLNAAIYSYKKDFIAKQWPNEKYKWEAVQYFQDHWNLEADDFAAMLEHSLSKTGNLLTSGNYFPAGMIQKFAKAAPEEVKAMFIALFDETQDVVSRVLAFKDQSAILLHKYGNGAKQHYQYENAITTYLWLRYPDKYYIYKYGEVKAVANALDCTLVFKKGAYTANLKNFYLLYDTICDTLKADRDLRILLDAQRSEDCYSDPELRTMTVDLGFYVSRIYQNTENDSEWWPKTEKYSPAITTEQWKTLLQDKEVFYPGSLEIMKRLLDYGGKATCAQLAIKYGETANFYNTGSSALAKRVHEKTGCTVMRKEDGQFEWWPILYVGRQAKKDDDGVFVWKLRDELAKALKKIDLSDVQLYANDDAVNDQRGYWWLNANPKIWSFSDIAVGEIQAYTLYNENGNKRRIFQNFLDAKAGDMIIGYECHPVKQVVAIGKVTAEQDGEKLYFEKIEGLSSPIDYTTLKDCPELERMEYFVNPQGSLFKLTKGEYEFILDTIREENPLSVPVETLEKYTKEEFLEDVYLSEARYHRLVSVLQKKKNIILQGAPGVGKTFAAKRLAYAMMGVKDDKRIEFVQFHQNYAYEDFMMGYKPEGENFELKYGVFYRFCQKAANHPDKDYFFIIDEINRGNLSKIFGELLMLIEKEYRGTKITLAYNGLNFAVPKNLYIIGMMNTADRSLAMIDYALRRRFSFFDMEPGFESDGFIKYQQSLNNDTFNELIARVKQLNSTITADGSLGKGFCIGHSYFCDMMPCTAEAMLDVVDYDIIPMLEEYWFDDQEQVQRWANILHGVFQ